MKRLTVGKHVVEWVASQTNEFGNFGAAVGIGLQESGSKQEPWKMVAGVVYNEWNGVNICAHIASNGSKRWMTREFLGAIFDYPFNQAKAKRLTVMVGEGNTESRNLVERFGFELETKLEGAHPTGDILVYVMRKPRAERWIRLRVSHEERIAA